VTVNDKTIEFTPNNSFAKEMQLHKEEFAAIAAATVSRANNSNLSL